MDWKEAAPAEGHQDWAASLAADWVEGSLALVAKTGQGSTETAAEGAAAVRLVDCLARVTAEAILGSEVEPKEMAAAGAAAARPEDCLAWATVEAVPGSEAEPKETAAAVAECPEWAMEVEERVGGVQED